MENWSVFSFVTFMTTIIASQYDTSAKVNTLAYLESKLNDVQNVQETSNTVTEAFQHVDEQDLGFINE